MLTRTNDLLVLTRTTLYGKDMSKRLDPQKAAPFTFGEYAYQAAGLTAAGKEGASRYAHHCAGREAQNRLRDGYEALRAAALRLAMCEVPCDEQAIGYINERIMAHESNAGRDTRQMVAAAERRLARAGRILAELVDRHMTPVGTSVLLLIDKSGKHSDHYAEVIGNSRSAVSHAFANWASQVGTNAEAHAFYNVAMEGGHVEWPYMRGSWPDDVYTMDESGIHVNKPE